ncbi:MAG: AAA family ATPase, partial [Bacteroidota bacterium]
MMEKFYNREDELEFLRKVGVKSQSRAQLTFVTGRRRIGKTALLTRSAKEDVWLYFFVAKKSESLLCMEYVELAKEALQVESYGTIVHFRELFSWLMELSKNLNFTLVIDEFQEFYSVNPAVYSEMQNIWDHKKDESKMNLICCGSIYSLMTKISENAREPLFGRANNHLRLQAFRISTIRKILADYHPGYTHDDLLCFYMITGGVAKYVEMLIDAQAYTKEAMLDQVFSEHSLFLSEGKNVLIDEFGKDYGNYFSILSLIASSKNSRSEIESVMEMPVGGFLDRL